MTKPVYISRGLERPFYLDAESVVQVLALEGEKCEVVTEHDTHMVLNYSMAEFMGMLETAQEAYWTKQREAFRPKPRVEDWKRSSVEKQNAEFRAAARMHEARMNERRECLERVLANWAKMSTGDFVNWLRDSILELKQGSN